MVGVDGSTTSRRAVAWAFQEASLWKTGVTAVHAWGMAGVGGSEPTMYGLLEPAQLERAEQEHAALLSESLAGWREEWPNVAVHEALVRGHPGQALVEASARARLLVVGTRAMAVPRPAVRLGELRHGAPRPRPGHGGSALTGPRHRCLALTASHAS